jgi:hypothetical protein
MAVFYKSERSSNFADCGLNPKGEKETWCYLEEMDEIDEFLDGKSLPELSESRSFCGVKKRRVLALHKSSSYGSSYICSSSSSMRKFERQEYSSPEL